MEELNGYFKQVVRDAIKDIYAGRVAYVFYEDQVNCVKAEFTDLKVVNSDGVYELSLPYRPKKKGGKYKGESRSNNVLG